jgi:hypothetical protein
LNRFSIVMRPLSSFAKLPDRFACGSRVNDCKNRKSAVRNADKAVKIANLAGSYTSPHSHQTFKRRGHWTPPSRRRQSAPQHEMIASDS